MAYLLLTIPTNATAPPGLTIRKILQENKMETRCVNPTCRSIRSGKFSFVVSTASSPMKAKGYRNEVRVFAESLQNIPTAMKLVLNTIIYELASDAEKFDVAVKRSDTSEREIEAADDPTPVAVWGEDTIETSEGEQVREATVQHVREKIEEILRPQVGKKITDVSETRIAESITNTLNGAVLNDLSVDSVRKEYRGWKYHYPSVRERAQAYITYCVSKVFRFSLTRKGRPGLFARLCGFKQTFDHNAFQGVMEIEDEWECEEELLRCIHDDAFFHHVIYLPYGVIQSDVQVQPLAPVKSVNVSIQVENKHVAD